MFSASQRQEVKKHLQRWFLIITESTAAPTWRREVRAALSKGITETREEGKKTSKRTWISTAGWLLCNSMHGKCTGRQKQHDGKCKRCCRQDKTHIFTKAFLLRATQPRGRAASCGAMLQFSSLRPLFIPLP